MRLAAAVALLVAAALAHGLEAQPIPPFSATAAGAALPGGWKARGAGRAPLAEVALVRDADVTVLEVRSHASAGAAALALRADTQSRPILAWRWKVDRVVQGADLSRREGDDFAARVYVFFDIPVAALPLADRVKFRLARLLYGEELPTAGICYVWDNRHPAETSGWNPYSARVRTVVVESGGARAGQWVQVRRDLESDFRTAFGAQWIGPVPALTGVVAGNDTDQTGESATARFGDLRLEARP